MAEHPPDIIEQIAELETRMEGKMFFTDQRRPLLDVIAEWQQKKDLQMELVDFGCGNSVCGV